MVKVVKKRRIFDDEADWLPPKGRAFKMKTGGKEEDQEADQNPRQHPRRHRRSYTRTQMD